MKPIKKKLGYLFPGVLGLFGFLLAGPPVSPDSLIPMERGLGVGLLFVFFLGSVFAWGAWIQDRIFKLQSGTLGTAIGFGTIAFSLLAQFALLVGWVHSPFYWMSLLWAGCLLAYFSKPSFRAPSLSLFAAISFGALSLTVILKALLPDGHFDALYYHLPAMKMWFDEGKMTTQNPVVFQSSSWDYLYLWAFSLVGSRNEAGLIESHVFSQLIHCCLGFIGTTLLFYDLLEKKVSHKGWLWAAILVGVSAPSILWVAPLAKNDWGSSLWILCGIYFLLLKRPLFGVSAFFLGMGLIAKLSQAWVLAPLVFVLLWRKSSTLREAFQFSFFFFLAMSPILIRNVYFVENPIFPALNHLFESSFLSMTFEKYNQTLTQGGFHFQIAHIKNELRHLWVQTPLILFLFFLSKELRWAGGILVVSFALFLMTTGKSTDLRLFGIGNLFLSSLSVLGLLGFLEKLRHLGGKKSLTFQLTPFALILFAFYKNPAVWQVWTSFSHSPSLTTMIRTLPPAGGFPHLGGDSKAWLRMNTSEKNQIVMNNPDIYYLSHLNPVSLSLDPKLDSLALNSDSPRGFVHELVKRGYRYYLDALKPEDFWKNPAEDALRKLAQKTPASIVFRGYNSAVIDLEKLANAESQGAQIAIN